jgi:hypothetical protein
MCLFCEYLFVEFINNLVINNFRCGNRKFGEHNSYSIVGTIFIRT